MQQVLLDHLRKITEEEQRILDGVAEVDKDLYTSGQDFTVDSAKMLSEGKLIAVRTRFSRNRTGKRRRNQVRGDKTHEGYGREIGVGGGYRSYRSHPPRGNG